MSVSPICGGACSLVSEASLDTLWPCSILLDAPWNSDPAFLGYVEQVSTNEALSCPQTARRRTACRPFAGKSALRDQSARSMASDVLQKSVEEVLKRPNTFKLDTCARGTPPSPLQALQHLKHGHDLDEKAWHHLHVKKHEADMIYDGSRLRRSELFGEADTSAHPAVEHTNGRRSHRRLCSACRFFFPTTAWQVRRLPRLSLPRRQLMLCERVVYRHGAILLILLVRIGFSARRF